MNKVAGFIAALTLAAPMAFAGGMDAPEMEEEVMAPAAVVEGSGVGSDDWVLGLMLLAIAAGIASS